MFGSRRILAELYNAGFLSRELYDKVVCCPSCGSANVSTRYSFPYCESFEIVKSSLIEHVKCGYMDVEEKFRFEDKLVCPKCHGELTEPDVNYRRVGVWCTCRGCGKSFDMPVAGHFCRECRHVFLFEDAVFKEAYVYRLNEAVKTEFLVGAITAPFKRIFEEKGFKVETPGFLEGKSGVKHIFDILAYREESSTNILAVNVAFSPEQGACFRQACN